MNAPKQNRKTRISVMVHMTQFPSETASIEEDKYVFSYVKSQNQNFGNGLYNSVSYGKSLNRRGHICIFLGKIAKPEFR